MRLYELLYNRDSVNGSFAIIYKDEKALYWTTYLVELDEVTAVELVGALRLKEEMGKNAN